MWIKITSYYHFVLVYCFPTYSLVLLIAIFVIFCSFCFLHSCFGRVFTKITNDILERFTFSVHSVRSLYFSIYFSPHNFVSKCMYNIPLICLSPIIYVCEDKLNINIFEINHNIRLPKSEEGLSSNRNNVIKFHNVMTHDAPPPTDFNLNFMH